MSRGTGTKGRCVMLGGDEILALLREKDQENTEERGGQAGGGRKGWKGRKLLLTGTAPHWFPRTAAMLRGSQDTTSAVTQAPVVRTLQVLPVAVPGESTPGWSIGNKITLR